MDVTSEYDQGLIYLNFSSEQFNFILTFYEDDVNINDIKDFTKQIGISDENSILSLPRGYIELRKDCSELSFDIYSIRFILNCSEEYIIKLRKAFEQLVILIEEND